jgi:ABC-2 type transport system ATP-binding protein
VFGLLGPNGAGKTTTVLMLLGLTEPTKGLVRVLGLDPTREPLAVKRRVGYLPDNVGFYGGMTGRENLRYTAKLNGLPRSEAEARIDELLHDVRLTDAADKRAETYSRGMRQRLGIADALVKRPSVLILDEPTIAIDPAGVEELLGLLRRLVAEHSLTVLLSSHILGQVQSLCDQVGFFSAGRMVAAGPLEELARGADRAIELEVGIDGPADAIDAVALAVAGVRSVVPHERDEHLRVVTAADDVAAPLAAALAGAGLSLIHLRRRGTDLLELYRRYVPEGLDGRTR